MLSLEHKTSSQMAPWFWRSIQPVALQMQCFLWETSKKFVCFVSFVHTQSTSQSKAAYFCLSCMCNASKSGFGKFRHKSFSYSQEKSERPCLLFFFFFFLYHEWQNPELLRGYLYFWNTLLIMMIFRDKYSTAVTVGMYAAFLDTVCFEKACSFNAQWTFPDHGIPNGWGGSAEEMLDGQHQRADIHACARTAHKGLLHKRLEEVLC